MNIIIKLRYTNTIAGLVYLLLSAQLSMFLVYAQSIEVVSITGEGTQVADDISPEHVNDGDITTRWSGFSDSGEVYLDLELENPHAISSLQIYFHKGDERKSRFVIAVSDDGTRFQNMTGILESEQELGFQEFLLVNNPVGKFVRIIGYGNNLSGWNAYEEIGVYGIPDDSGTNPVAEGPLQEWLQDNSLDLFDTGGDEDGDGMSNLLEFVLNSDPNDNSNEAVLPKVDSSIDPAVFSYTRRKDSTEETYQEVCYSDDLINWTCIPIIESSVVQIEEKNDITETVEVDLPSSENKKLFARLNVSLISDLPPPENTLNEIAYFDTYLLPQTEAANLQEALDTHGAVRLGEGDYSAAGGVTMSSNQRLYGTVGQRGTFLGGHVTIKAGASNVHLENFDGNNIYDVIFESGAPISDSTFHSIFYSELVLDNGMLENNHFINISRVKTSFNCSTSGYFRNNIFIKIFHHAADDQVTMIGNDVTPSYGNLELSRNILTNRANSTHYENLDNHKLVGFDAETWANREGADANAAFYFRDTGNLKMFTGNGYSASGSPEFDVEADEFIFIGKRLRSVTSPILRANTNYMGVYQFGAAPIKEDNVWEFSAHNDSGSETELNDTDIAGALTGADAERLKNLILDTEYTPLPKPNFARLPDPTGENWATDRIGQVDESSAIQALIDQNGIAELEDRIYYIAEPLYLEKGEGIVGKGTGQTAIVGLTDDFPLIHCQDDVSINTFPGNIYAGQVTNVSYKIAQLTLQGGSDGIYVQPIGNENTVLQITNTAWRNLIFRNQTHGIHLDSFFGFDNNFLQNLNFVECEIGFYQNAQPRPEEQASGEWATMMYIDKTVFYQCQFIDCGVGLDMRPFRGNNLDAWVDCLFDGNGIAMRNRNSNSLYCSNSVFRNTHGSFVQGGGVPMSYFSCDFENNTTPILFDNFTVLAEGSNFNDTMLFNAFRRTRQYYLWNNIIHNIISLDNINKGFFINNNVVNNSDLSKLMVEVVDHNSLTILDEPSTPYPQLLVTQEE